MWQILLHLKKVVAINESKLLKSSRLATPAVC